MEGVQGKDKGKWREANRRCQLQNAIHAGIMPPPLPMTMAEGHEFCFGQGVLFAKGAMFFRSKEGGGGLGIGMVLRGPTTRILFKTLTRALMFVICGLCTCLGHPFEGHLVHLEGPWGFYWTGMWLPCLCAQHIAPRTKRLEGGMILRSGGGGGGAGRCFNFHSGRGGDPSPLDHLPPSPGPPPPLPPPL